MEKDIWTANKYISEPVSDGGKPRIPTLRVKAPNCNTREIYANEDKAKALVNSFFPKKPAELTVPANPIYPQPLDEPDQLFKERIHRHIAKLSPHKVPGPDGIPNIILQ